MWGVFYVYNANLRIQTTYPTIVSAFDWPSVACSVTLSV